MANNEVRILARKISVVVSTPKDRLEEFARLFIGATLCSSNGGEFGFNITIDLKNERAFYEVLGNFCQKYGLKFIPPKEEV